MAPLFSKVDSNKLWLDIQHEENMIYAEFGKDLFNIFKVIGRKKVAQFFLTHSVHSVTTHYQQDNVQRLTHISDNRMHVDCN